MLIALMRDNTHISLRRKLNEKQDMLMTRKERKRVKFHMEIMIDDTWWVFTVLPKLSVMHSWDDTAKEWGILDINFEWLVFSFNVSIL